MGSTGVKSSSTTVTVASSGEPRDINDYVKQFTQDTGVAVDPNLISKIDPKALVVALDAIRKAKTDNPDALKAVTTVEIRNKANSLASTDGTSIKLNTDYWSNYDKLKKAYDDGVASGFHPAGTGVESIIDHELGHAMVHGIIQDIHGAKSSYYGLIDSLKDWSKGTTPKKMVNDAAKEIQANYKALGYKKKPTIMQLREEISKYASRTEKVYPDGTPSGQYKVYNEHETVAEAWADWSANGTKAKPLSKVLASYLLNSSETAKKYKKS